MTVNGFFNILTRVDSTNNYAMAMIHAGMAEHGMAWFAREQTAGRGQRGREWLSEPGQNIMLSVALTPSLLKNHDPFRLSMIVATTCQAFFATRAGEETLIKWPNDLYWRDRKAGGILIENSYAGTNWQWAVVGIGININQVVFAPDTKNPVSLRQITGNIFDAEALARELQTLLLAQFSLLAAAGSPDLPDLYNNLLYGRHRQVRLKKGSQVFETTILGVSAAGKLLTRDTLPREFTVGEVEWLGWGTTGSPTEHSPPSGDRGQRPD